MTQRPKHEALQEAGSAIMLLRLEQQLEALSSLFGTVHADLTTADLEQLLEEVNTFGDLVGRAISRRQPAAPPTVTFRIGPSDTP